MSCFFFEHRIMVDLNCHAFLTNRQTSEASWHILLPDLHYAASFSQKCKIHNLPFITFTEKGRACNKIEFLFPVGFQLVH